MSEKEEAVLDTAESSTPADSPLKDLRREVHRLRQRLSKYERLEQLEREYEDEGGLLAPMRPIGIFESCFKQKQATPRQGRLCATTRGRLKVIWSADHFFDGIDQFEYIWLVYVFHLNNNVTRKGKVSPPKLDGLKLGVFATRSPHRPNPIGLCCVKLEKMIDQHTILVSGIDLIDGTPILDIKPYVTPYDAVPTARVPYWIKDSMIAEEQRITEVEFSEKSLQDLKRLVGLMQFYNAEEFELVKDTLKSVLSEDPRSINQIEKTAVAGECEMATYFDNLNITFVAREQKIVVMSIELAPYASSSSSPSPISATPMLLLHPDAAETRLKNSES